MEKLHVIILAAGQGTRMKSALPKVLHAVGGIPMLERVARTAAALEPSRISVVYGHGGEVVKERLAHLDVNWVEQDRQLGTGHAVAQALPGVAQDARVLVLYGDVPLTGEETLRRLVAAANDGLALLTIDMPDPTGYGRVVRDDAGHVVGVVEQKDADADQLRIREVNTGLLAVDGNRLRRWVDRLDNRNAQGEYYLTDIFAMAVTEGVAIRAVAAASEGEVTGVNDRVQLAFVERLFQRAQAERLMREGVTLADPARLDIRGRLTAARDVSIDVNVVIEGDVAIGEGARIGPNVVLRDATVAAGAEIKAMTVIEDAHVGRDCQVGPFARLRPGTRLADNARVGNFVEIKKSEIGRGSKVNHLSYVGDAKVGEQVNIGAGTITCNYDGANKHVTIIGDRAFIGSDTQLVAPVEVGPDATIGAGSTVTRDAPAGELTLSRAPQKSVSGWKRPTKKK